MALIAKNFFGSSYLSVYGCICTVGGSSNVVTATMNGYVALAIDEFSSGSTNSQDGSAVWTTGTSASVTSSNVNFSGANDLIYAGANYTVTAGAATWTAGTGYTLSFNAPQASSKIPIGTCYALNVASSPATPNMTISNALQTWGIIGVAFTYTSTGQLLTASALDGLGGGGPFFSDPLSRI